MKYYRVRKAFKNIKSQKGVYCILDNAISVAIKTKCNIYDENGSCVWKYDENIMPKYAAKDILNQHKKGVKK